MPWLLSGMALSSLRRSFSEDSCVSEFVCSIRSLFWPMIVNILCFSRFWTNPFRVDLVFEGRTVRDTYPSNLQPKKNRAVIAASALKDIAVRRATHPSVQRNYLSEEMFWAGSFTHWEPCLFHRFTFIGITSVLVVCLFGFCLAFLGGGFVFCVVWLVDWFSRFMHMGCTRSSSFQRLSPSSRWAQQWSKKTSHCGGFMEALEVQH